MNEESAFMDAFYTEKDAEQLAQEAFEAGFNGGPRPVEEPAEKVSDCAESPSKKTNTSLDDGIVESLVGVGLFIGLSLGV